MPTFDSVQSNDSIEDNLNLINTNGQDVKHVLIAQNSFTILNNDNLHTNVGKPNAIVRPIRRVDPLGDAGYVLLNNNDINTVLNKKVTEPNYELGNFTTELDFKLRRLQKEKIKSSKNVILFYLIFS